MEEIDFINMIVEVMVNIVCPLVVIYVTNRKITEESKFFSYITFNEEKFVKNTHRKSNILIIVFLVLYLVVGLNRILYLMPINEKVSNIAQMIGLFILLLITIGQCLCNFILAFLDIDYFDKKMRKQKRNIVDIGEGINVIITTVCVVGFGIMAYFRNNTNVIILIAYSTLLITLGVEIIYNSFISVYVKLRCLYQVEEIIIRTKTFKKVYRNIFKYRIKSDVYEFVCEDKNILKCIKVPVNEVESVEKRIDIKKNYLDIMRVKEENIMKKQNKEKKIWSDFINQNKEIVIVSIIAIIYCIICVFFKSSEKLNINKNIYPWGEFLFNIAISVIAAVIFFIVQTFIPNRKKEQTLKKYAKRYLKEVVLAECNILKIRTDLIYKGEKDEDEMKEAINSSCVKIKNGLNEYINKYLQVLPESLIEAINDVLFDDMFYSISIRVNGSLKNQSLKEILQDKVNYQLLWKKIKRIKEENDGLL